MSAIGKTFQHDDEHFIVALIGIGHFICISKRDKRAWRFSFSEMRKLFRKKK